MLNNLFGNLLTFLWEVAFYLIMLFFSSFTLQSPSTDILTSLKAKRFLGIEKKKEKQECKGSVKSKEAFTHLKNEIQTHSSRTKSLIILLVCASDNNQMGLNHQILLHNLTSALLSIREKKRHKNCDCFAGAGKIGNTFNGAFFQHIFWFQQKHDNIR